MSELPEVLRSVTGKRLSDVRDALIRQFFASKDVQV
ncbi:hypothetical protein SAMN05216288_4552 [Pseudomonas punonensis]|uniref:Uncharacterized protein n=1 Tax=Phytopseudomonas punonensis TaxID=1220495 RepID=A0A1M7ME84_9GAMM|nr:hypothetical protein SAMN05216288_4552 [Pseudomonas punonensis]